MKFTAAAFALLVLPSVSATWLRGINDANNTDHDIDSATEWDGVPKLLHRPFPPTTTVATTARRAQAVTPIYSILVDNTSNDPLFSGLNIPANAAQAGMWSSQFPWPIVSIHAAVLSDGRLVTYGSPTGVSTQDGRLFVFWNPKQGTGSNSMQTVPNAQPVDSFCSSGALMPSGKFFVTGGNGLSGKGTTILDPFTSTPTRSFDLNFPRWYSTLTILPNGQHVITGGGTPYLNGIYAENPSSSGTVSNIPEIFTDGQGWRVLNGAKSDDAFGFPNNHFWYPRQWVSPTGSVFGVSTEKIWEMQVGGDGSIRTIGNFKTAPNTKDNTLPNTGPTSAAVMYDTGKIIQVGGNGYNNGYGSQSSNQATIFDINGIGSGNVVVRDTQRMNFPRQWSTAIVLPNGRVLVTGGSKFADSNNANAVLQAEIWDPATERWTIGASAAVYRGYHSTACLLPNGAVFTGGGGIPGPVNNFNAEIYFPPYLFKAQNGGSVLAKRPTIISLSANGGTYGSRIQVQLAPGDDCAEVSFSTLGSVTHAFDSNLRRMRLHFQRIANGVEITLPANANLAPPGYYYINIVNGQGVPSNAVIFAMNSLRPPTPATIPPPSTSKTTKWQCIVDNKAVGDIGIWWGHDAGTAAWACNAWNNNCGGRCSAAKITEWLCFADNKGKVGNVGIWWENTAATATWACNEWNGNCGGQCYAGSAWTCKLNGQPVGTVEIWWENTAGAATWACNAWNAACNNGCSVSGGPFNID